MKQVESNGDAPYSTPKRKSRAYFNDDDIERMKEETIQDDLNLCSKSIADKVEWINSAHKASLAKKNINIVGMEDKKMLSNGKIRNKGLLTTMQSYPKSVKKLQKIIWSLLHNLMIPITSFAVPTTVGRKMVPRSTDSHKKEMMVGESVTIQIARFGTVATKLAKRNLNSILNNVCL